ncbi:hypothetical protein [Rhodovibrio salinarum]|uniref:Uncharacterized protein n=1 Tax=Rhodovibrio salinarum TaxID=1087 RepID=A0A934UZ76_9PROT|nr:hypothetical protein [Rhodovibrio salinarum]MBK1696100.1 hypothetical protein [Rhodovibrio salinarum]
MRGKHDRLPQALTLGIIALGIAGAGALLVGVLLEIGFLFLAGVGGVVGALVGHNTLDAYSRRKSFDPGQQRGPWD